MKTSKTLTNFSKGYIIFSALSLLSVSLMAIADPQSVMDLVQTTLPNTDAYSSIRGIYGGVGIAIVISLLSLLRKHTTMALGFLSLFWGSYALSRLITMFADGPLGDFGHQWLFLETIFCMIALLLYRLRKAEAKRSDLSARNLASI